MKTKQTPRYRWLFYRRSRSLTGDANTYGEMSETITFITSGFFAYEKAKHPIEILDAGATISEVQYVLLGSHSSHYCTTIRNHHFAWCPHLNKVVELISNPIDDTGTQERVVIYVIDNVERDWDTSALPTS